MRVCAAETTESVGLTSVRLRRFLVSHLIADGKRLQTERLQHHADLLFGF
jgi:hypothetical protein